jgi:subtilisin family serine protease
MHRWITVMGRKSFAVRAAAGLLLSLGLAVGSPAWGQAWDEADRQAVLASGVVGEPVLSALDVADEVRVVVVYHGRADRSRADAIIARVSRRHLGARHRFHRLPAMAVTVTRDGLLALVADPRVRRIDLDEGGGGDMGVAVPLVGLDILQGQGFGGEGITVALLDTGADLDHPDLVDSIVGEECFCTSCCPNGGNRQSGAGAAEDDHGHGTSIAGIITSNGTIAPPGGAPDADIVLVKVLDENNSFCCSSNVIAGLDWIIDQRPDVDVVNMSLGTNASYLSDCDDASATTMAFAAAIDALRANGVLVVSSSGNQGLKTTMPAPACVANAIAVAASDDMDVVWGPSNTDPTTDLFTPGVLIQSTGLAAETSIFTGTSQASALTASCAAVLLGANPLSTADEVAAALVGSTTILTDPNNKLDIPRLDCAESRTLLPEPGPGVLVAATLVALALGRRRTRARR